MDEPDQRTLIDQHGLRVLVVDDNRDAADTLAAMLELLGHLVQVAYDGTTALGIAPGFAPQLVVLDIGLPGIDGYELARRLRPVLPRARMVALTGYGGDAARRQALAAGCDEHFVKPMAAEDLLAILGRAGEGRRESPPPRLPEP